MSLHSFLADQKITRLWKKCILWHPIAWATSYCLLPNTLWLRASKNDFKAGSIKFANSLLPLWRKFVPEIKAANGLKRCWAKIKGVNNHTWTAQYQVWLQKTELFRRYLLQFWTKPVHIQTYTVIPLYFVIGSINNKLLPISHPDILPLYWAGEWDGCATASLCVSYMNFW